MTTTIKEISNMLLAFVLCAGLMITSCETADPVGNDKDPDNSENTGDTGNTGSSGNNNSSSDIIVFASDIVKESCVEAFDTDGDGEISYGEAAAVRDLSNVNLRFLDESLKIKEITFDEFQYFTNVISIPDKFFMESKHLKSIMLPKSLKAIGKNAFAYCDGLTTIEFPDELRTIGEYAFYQCYGLTGIDFPVGLKTIERRAFAECTGLTIVDFPEGLETIGEGAFHSCEGLTAIYCRPLSPPTVSDTSFPRYQETIYVPRESVKLYKNTSSWYYYSDNIVGYDF